MREWESNPFQDSLAVVAEIALRTTGAQGYAFFQKAGSTGAFIRLAAGGGVIPAGNAEEERALLEYPLHTDTDIVASVAFAFSSEAEALQSRPRLERIAEAIQRVWEAATAKSFTKLADRVADLEARLMDSKVADRARGLLISKSDGDPAEAIARHVEAVLRPTQIHRILEQVLSELEDEIDERRLMAEAKQILQAVDRLSEEQAHTRLRVMSRKSRKRLKEVAQQVIQDQRLLQGRSA
jgi:AmiR/NasT family two-component response regulator